METETPDAPAVPAEPQNTQADYFSFGESKQHMLPDGVSYVSFVVMNEGQRRKFQHRTNRSVDIDRKTEKMSMLLTPVEDNHALIETAVDGWNLKRGGDDVPFSPNNLKAFLDSADPKLVDEIGEAIREGNPWMLTESMTVEAIDEEIEELTRRRKLILEQELGKAD